MNELKQVALQSMQTTSHEIKYQKQSIESTVRAYREKTKGDVWTEMLEWWDFIRELESSIHDIRDNLIRYHDMHRVVQFINEHEGKDLQ